MPTRTVAVPVGMRPTRMSGACAGPPMPISRVSPVRVSPRWPPSPVDTIPSEPSSERETKHSRVSGPETNRTALPCGRSVSTATCQSNVRVWPSLWGLTGWCWHAREQEIGRTGWIPWLPEGKRSERDHPDERDCDESPWPPVAGGTRSGCAVCRAFPTCGLGRFVDSHGCGRGATPASRDAPCPPRGADHGNADARADRPPAHEHIDGEPHEQSLRVGVVGLQERVSNAEECRPANQRGDQATPAPPTSRNQRGGHPDADQRCPPRHGKPERVSRRVRCPRFSPQEQHRDQPEPKPNAPRGSPERAHTRCAHPSHVVDPPGPTLSVPRGQRPSGGHRLPERNSEGAVSPHHDRIAVAEHKTRCEVRVVECPGGISVTRLTEHDPIPGPPDERAPIGVD